MIDALTEIDNLKLAIQLFDFLVNDVVKVHAWSHKARLDALHCPNVFSLLGQRHLVEGKQLFLRVY